MSAGVMPGSLYKGLGSLAYTSVSTTKTTTNCWVNEISGDTISHIEVIKKWQFLLFLCIMSSWRPGRALLLPKWQCRAITGMSVDVQMDIINHFSIQLPSSPACFFVFSLRVCYQLSGRFWNPCSSLYDEGFLLPGRSFWFHREVCRRGLQ